MGLSLFTSSMCDSDDPYLEVSVSSMDFSSKGESQVFSIKSNVAWSISGHESWVTVNPTIGKNKQTISVIVEENTTRETKQCTMTVSTNGSLSQTVTITQKASDALLAVDNNNLYFASEKGDSKTLTISSNGPWEIRNIPTWLRASSTSGNGNSLVTFTTTNTNRTSSPQEETIEIISDGESIFITVSQEGGAAKNCKVTPDHMTILDNGVAFDLIFESEVVRYRCGYMNASNVGYMSDEEIVGILEQEVDLILRTSDYIPNLSGLEEGTGYIVYTLGYDKDGQRGDLVKTPFTTNTTITNEPLAWIGDVTKEGWYWYWSITESARCDYYYMMTTEDYELAMASDAYQAFLIDKAIREGTISEYVNGGNWEELGFGSFFAVWTRGVDAKGIMANTLSWNYGTDNQDDSKIIQKSKNVSGETNSIRFQYSEKSLEDKCKLYLIK